MLSWIRRERPGSTSHTSNNAKVRPSLEALEDRRVPAAPVLDVINNVTLPAGKSLIIPLTASDADGNPLTYTATTDNPSVTAFIHTGNPYLRLQVQYTPSGQTTVKTGELVFQLLRDVAPNVVDKITGLVNDGFYNNKTFYRLDPNFVIQGGGDSAPVTGPGFPFDDQFNANAIFTGDFQLAMAKSTDDTNSSEFFITLRNATNASNLRALDFNHSIFGQLVRGRDIVREISNVPGTAFPGLPGSVRPTNAVTITNASLVPNTTDAVLTLTSSSPTTTTANVTVRVGDGQSSITPPVVDPNLPANVRFVSQTFQQLLDRAPDSGGLSAWTGLLERGVSRRDVVLGIERSTEYRTKQITSIYQDFLGRAPDAGGLQSKLSFMAQGGTLEEVRRAILTSDEYFQQRGGSTEQGYLGSLYQDILGRAIDTSGQATYLRFRGQGATREELVAVLMSSAEAQRHLANSFYNEVLSRNGDTAGLNEATRALGLGVREEVLVAGLVNSAEGDLIVTSPTPVPEGSASRTFTANTVTDTITNNPFLGPVGNQTTTANTAVTFSLTATDIEPNGQVTFSVTENKANTGDPDRVTINVVGNQVTLTPISPTFTGTVNLLARVRRAGQTALDPSDTQQFTLTITAP